MIVADKKPLEEVKASIGEARRILVVGCDTCVAECAAGGRKEVSMTASALSMAYKKAGETAEIREAVLDRQCVNEFLPLIGDEVDWAEAVVSLGCGAGVQALARFYPRPCSCPDSTPSSSGSPWKPGSGPRTVRPAATVNWLFSPLSAP